MWKFHFYVGVVAICSAMGSTGWWLNDAIHTSSNQVRAEMTQSINRVEDRLTKVEDGLTEVRGDLTEVINKVHVDLTQSSNKVRDDLTQAINKVRVDMTQSFGEVRGDIRVLGTRVGGLEADVKDLKTDVKDLQTDVKGKVKVNNLEDDVRGNNEYLREREIQSVPNDASTSETPIPKEDPVKLRKISAENKP